MAIETVAAQACIQPEPDFRQGVSSAFLDLHQIRAIAQMMNDHSAVDKVDFPHELSGGILAVLTIAGMGCDKIDREMFGKRDPSPALEG